VPGEPFYFALEFSSPDVSAALLGELAARVLGYVGCSRQDLPQLDRALAEAASVTAAQSRLCDVRFRLQDGALEILVSSSAGRLFHASHPIPDRP
jgi:hypothetical protein